ncbi:putative RNA-directed DNA polymerase from transposon X-element, partial [Stegodyphus mimosarum]
MISVMPSEVYDYIKKLKNTKSPGYDQITNRMIKKFPVKTQIYFTKIVNLVLKWQHFPECWKLTNIMPIPKLQKAANLPESYRPISLLSLSKIVKAVLLLRINQHLDQHGIIIPYQFAFRRKQSTVNQLYRVVEFISEGLQNKSLGVFSWILPRLSIVYGWMHSYTNYTIW